MLAERNSLRALSKHPNRAGDPPRTDARPGYKPIILIGGAPGCGKSTCASEICCTLQFDHRMSTGFIREIVREHTSPAECPVLLAHTIHAEDPVAALVAQAERILPHVRACIRRAREEGISLVVEGSLLVPAFYRDLACDLYVMMTTPPRTEHRRRLQGPSHARRRIRPADVQRSHLIGDYLEQQAADFRIPRAPYLCASEIILGLLRRNSDLSR